MIRLALFLTFLFAAALSATAQEPGSLLPDIPKATGEPHPEGNEFWRRNHMKLMRHDRDLTMRSGDREITASLTGCFDCHAATDAAGDIVTYESDEHFCRTCHDYVAVKVDCFMCHRSTPEGVDEGHLHGAVLPLQRPQQDSAKIVAYLSGISSGSEASQ